ncbi:MAG: hypothetical protein ACOX8U_07700 [Bradymonadia bacterium]|jgi:hypothetical protein
MFFRIKILALPLFYLCACLLSACNWDGDIARFTGERCPPVNDGADQPKKILSKRCKENPKDCHYHSEIGRCEDNYMCVPDPADASGLTFECNKDCPDTQKLCSVSGGGSVCANTQTDPKHCGDCNKSCNDGEPCDGGKCGCSKAKAFCNNACIDPKNSNKHCGAKGNCEGNDPDVDNYEGVECGQERYCDKGACKCRGNLVWCDEKCIDPNTNQTYCGAKGLCTADEGEDFRGVSCDSNSHCRGGECIPFACDDGEVLCRNTDGKLACVDVKNDPENCGQCGWSCKDKMYGSLKTTYISCQGGKCQYECVPLEGCTDSRYCNAKECNSDVHYPDFVCSADVYKTAAYCGGCYNGLGTACKGNEPICVDSSKGYECSGSNCSNGNFCRLNGCENSSKQCGRSCVDCTQLPYVAAADCSEDGACIITKCKKTFHPSADGSHCVPNTPEICAPAETTSEKAINCTGIAHAASVACTVDGACLVNSCKAGFHINDTRDACMANVPSACGRVTAFGNEVRDCTANVADGAAQCNADGICEVSICVQDYHLSLDGRRCEANTINACGAIDSNKLEDCTRWGANYKCIAGKCEE